MVIPMKVVQTRLNSIEYEMLRKYAEAKGLTITEALREIIRKAVMEEEIDKNDPIFVEGPAAKRTGQVDRTSEEHDKVLYGDRD